MREKQFIPDPHTNRIEFRLPLRWLEGPEPSFSTWTEAHAHLIFLQGQAVAYALSQLKAAQDKLAYAKAMKEPGA